MKFLDSNVLIYAADETDLAKFDKACDIVDTAVRGNGFMISAQVLNEFASVMFKKFKTGRHVFRFLALVAYAVRHLRSLRSYRFCAFQGFLGTGPEKCDCF